MSARKGKDPYAKTCTYTEEGAQFGERFECTERLEHKGSHYDSFLNRWAPNTKAKPV